MARTRAQGEFAALVLLLLAASASPAHATIQRVVLEASVSGLEQEHVGELDEFAGSASFITRTDSAQASYELSADRLDATFALNHSRLSPTLSFPRAEVGFLIRPERDLQYTVSGEYSFADRSQAIHTAFGLTAKIRTIVGSTFGPSRDDPLFYTVGSFSSLGGAPPYPGASGGVASVEFGPSIANERSLGSLQGSFQGVLEAGRVYGFFVDSHIDGIVPRDAQRSAIGSGVIEFSLSPIPEPSTALLLALGLGLLARERGHTGSNSKALESRVRVAKVDHPSK